ncbi:patatin-like phospholipase family protein [Geodermatophilus marinus]|nr:patatin-like phospholipase family protein [Geodermatophilus sp. LHW52908]
MDPATDAATDAAADPAADAAGRGGTAFVLGGGGVLGAAEVGMLRALFERGIRPDLVVGTSVGAINGALVAADPAPAAVDRLRGVWEDLASAGVFAGSVLTRARTLVRTRTHLHPREPLRDLLAAHLPVRTFAELAVPFQCVAASIERAAERWFTEGALLDAVLASCAVPGLLPPVELGGEHYLDGGLVHSIPVGRAVTLGADRVFVLHVGRIDRPLRPPARPWEVAQVAFEIARRHRFAADLAALPPGVTVHVLPSGERAAASAGDLRDLRYRDFSRVPERIDRAYEAAAGYLAEAGDAGGAPSGDREV